MTVTLIVVTLVAILLVLLIERSGMDGSTARVLSLIVIGVALIFIALRATGHA